MSNDKMRAQFEVGKSARDLTRSSRKPDEYLIDAIQINWSHWQEAWQAALEHKPALAQQASEPVQFKFPRDPDPESPWVIDFDFLMRVRDLIEDVDFTPCLEDVEEVLRVVEELYPTPSKPEVSQPYAYECGNDSKSELYYAAWFKFRELPDNAKPIYLAQPEYEALKWKYEGALESIRDHQKLGGELTAKIKNLEELAQDDQETIEALETECKRFKLRVTELKGIAIRSDKVITEVTENVIQIIAERDRLQSECDSLVKALAMIRNSTLEEAAMSVDDQFLCTENGDTLVICAENIRAMKEQE